MALNPLVDSRDIRFVLFEMLEVDKLGEKFIGYIDKIFALLEVFESTFWEDTDRGNLNIYFTGNREYIGRFREMLFEKVSG